MAQRWIEQRETEILKARPIIIGRERDHQKERIGGYNLRAPCEYTLYKGKTVQFRLVMKNDFFI